MSCWDWTMRHRPCIAPSCPAPNRLDKISEARRHHRSCATAALHRLAGTRTRAGRTKIGRPRTNDPTPRSRRWSPSARARSRGKRQLDQQQRIVAGRLPCSPPKPDHQRGRLRRDRAHPRRRGRPRPDGRPPGTHLPRRGVVVQPDHTVARRVERDLIASLFSSGTASSFSGSRRRPRRPARAGVGLASICARRVGDMRRAVEPAMRRPSPALPRSNRSIAQPADVDVEIGQQRRVRIARRRLELGQARSMTSGLSASGRRHGCA